MFVQRSEFNSGSRIALYKNYLLLLCVASINSSRQGCRPVNKRWHSQREGGGGG